MAVFDRDVLERYLSGVCGGPVRVESISPLGGGGESKGYGYGVPLLVTYAVGGARRRAVLETTAPGPFGHEHFSDRAQGFLWAHDAFNRLPHHARSLDVGAVRRDGGLVSLGSAEEFFIVMDFVDGAGYFQDLARLKLAGPFGDRDFARADALCDYLVGIHAVRGNDPGLYARRIRELVGHGECIMGVIDSYPAGHAFLTPDVLRDLERRCVDWRWKLKGRVHRLCQVHGDFHPWNILFREGTDFSVLDRSRGEWGDAADDVTCLTMNYLFFALQANGDGRAVLMDLFRRFWRRYLERSGDAEILEVAAPFFAFRGLVLASPVWYPRLDDRVRRTLLAFMTRLLDAPGFDPQRIDEWVRDE